MEKSVLRPYYHIYGHMAVIRSYSRYQHNTELYFHGQMTVHYGRNKFYNTGPWI